MATYIPETIEIVAAGGKIKTDTHIPETITHIPETTKEIGESRDGLEGTLTDRGRGKKRGNRRVGIDSQIPLLPLPLQTVRINSQIPL